MNDAASGRAGPELLSPAERARLAEAPPGPGLFEKLLAELPSLDRVESQPPPSSPDPPSTLRIACWNVERGRRLDSLAALLGLARPDVCLLSELDHGMARTGNLHTARELASLLGAGFVYGVEFVELGLGDEHERAAHAGETNAVGFHGAAILSPHALSRARLVRLERSGRWFDGTLGERRIGGRMALLAEIATRTGPVALASVHLESHGDAAGRAGELGVLLDAIDAWAPGRPVVIGGDLNTSTLSREDLDDRDRLRRRIEEDRERFAHPERYEPLFALAESRGYTWRESNDLTKATHRQGEPTRRGVAHLDWFLVRGLRPSGARVVAAVEPAGGALSDHELLLLDCDPER